jgi:hypothetical protein
MQQKGLLFVYSLTFEAEKTFCSHVLLKQQQLRGVTD